MLFSGLSHTGDGASWSFVIFAPPPFFFFFTENLDVILGKRGLSSVD